eukprot:scaffold12294_cov69-Skeletonema_marinoi.AAC.1
MPTQFDNVSVDENPAPLALSAAQNNFINVVRSSVKRSFPRISLELPVQRGEQFDDVFEEFDEVPLGSASVAQVHHAVLTKKYGHREVAVKVQRPSIEDKLMGDVFCVLQLLSIIAHHRYVLHHHQAFFKPVHSSSDNPSRTTSADDD